MWYPQDKKELESLLSLYLTKEKKPKNVTGLIVPHAGYEFSGAIAGKAFSLLKPNINKAVIIGPSHYVNLSEVVTSDKKEWQTPISKIALFNENFPTMNIEQEHSITNQIPFLQKLNTKQILPLMVGQITNEQAQETAEKLSKISAMYVFSTDLSHFLPYEQAEEKDKISIKIVENLDIKNYNEVDACGFYPILICINLCKIKHTFPKMIQYKNSGDVTGDKSAVVGYASFWF